MIDPNELLNPLVVHDLIHGKLKSERPPMPTELAVAVAESNNLNALVQVYMVVFSAPDYNGVDKGSHEDECVGIVRNAYEHAYTRIYGI